MRRPAVAGLVMALALLGLLPHVAAAVTCTAKVDRSEVAPGERLTLTVTVEGAFQSAPPVELPPLDGIEVVSGGTSQQFSFVNGRVSASVSTTFYLEVMRDSSFTIPSLTVQLEGRAYSTQPIPVSVRRGAGGTGGRSSARSAPASPAAPAPAAPPPATDASGSGGRPGDGVFITLTADRTEAFVGQQIVLTFRFHRRVQLWDNPQYTAPRTEGFWREDLGQERSFVQVIAGHRYQVTEVRYALFPTRPGSLVIEPAEVAISGDLFDRLFSLRSRRSAGAQRLRTRRLPVEVRPLPVPRPADFGGLVAEQVSLAVDLDRPSVPRGEPVTLRIALTADGFLQGLRELPFSAPQSVQVHDATEELGTDKSGERLLSRYTVEKVLVPSEEGELRLAPVTVSYFDPRAGEYRTARREGPLLRVVASDLPVAGDAPEALVRGTIERLGQDLAFIHAPAGRLGTRDRPLPTLPAWWAAVLAPLLGLLALRWHLSRAERERRDPLGVRRRRAFARARRTLGDARRREGTEALAGLVRAVSGYVADRTGRAPASIGVGEVEAFGARLGEPETGRLLAGLLARCDAERFGRSSPSAGPDGDGATAPADLVGEAERLLGLLEKRAARSGAKAAAARGASLLVLLLLALPATHVCAQNPPVGRGADPARLLAEGNQAYTAGDHAAALKLYRQALEQGVNDPVLHYNLGNAYARQGQLGRAVLAYLRAERLAPRDRDVKANLAWLRTLLRDQELAPGGLPPVVGLLARPVRALSMDEWSLILLAVLWLLCALVAWGWYRGEVSDNLRRLHLAGGTVLVLLLLIVGWLWYEQEVRDQAVVVVPEAEVRSGPAATFPVVFRVHDGLSLTVRGERESWLRIGLGGEWVGWVPAGTVESVRPDGLAAPVAADVLLRDGGEA